MTNREYIETLTDEEMSYFIYSVLIPMGRRYTDSPLGIAQWLGEPYKGGDAE